MIISESCGGQNSTINTGPKEQCTPKPAVTHILAKDTFSFPTVAASRDQANWDVAKAAKDVVPMYKIEGLQLANTDAKKYEGRFENETLKAGIKGVDYNHLISDSGYRALKTYNNSSVYTKVFRVLDDGTFHCEVTDDGKVHGEPLISYDVGVLNESTDDKPQNVDIQLKFDDYQKSTIKPDFAIKKYAGIYDLDLVQASATATSMKVKVTSYGANVDSLLTADFVVKDESGSVVTPTFVPPVDGVYEFTGTGFVDGYTIEINGVVVQTNYQYEGANIVTVDVT